VQFRCLEAVHCWAPGVIRFSGRLVAASKRRFVVDSTPARQFPSGLNQLGRLHAEEARSHDTGLR
jgi:hypothetical protein